MKPYYEIDEVTTMRILELTKKCDSFCLDNVKFEYTSISSDIIFSMDRTDSGWILDVISRRINATRELDEYKIIDGQLIYQYSEKD